MCTWWLTWKLCTTIQCSAESTTWNHYEMHTVSLSASSPFSPSCSNLETFETLNWNLGGMRKNSSGPTSSMQQENPS
jgi:hypothetical protein